MKTPVVLVAVSLAMAILLSASLLIATGARGEDGLGRIGPPHIIEHSAGSEQQTWTE